MYERPDGKFQGTFIEEAINVSLARGLSNAPYSPNELQEDFTQEYTIITPAPQLLKVGDKCEVLEILTNFEKVSETAKNMV